jgi:flavin reductase (DIM6/NTAB) family NADH-FMN oxidoreductase RutF
MTTSAQPLTPDDRLMAQHHLRSALGHFATGLTVNSFSSVSLERALVLCSLSTHSPNLDAFCDGSAHVMHVCPMRTNTWPTSLPTLKATC